MAANPPAFMRGALCMRILTIPGANAPPLLNQGEAFGGASLTRKMTVYAIMYMKKQRVTGDSINLSKVVCG